DQRGRPARVRPAPGRVGPQGTDPDGGSRGGPGVTGKETSLRVCVTGAAGFIGANLVARLKAEGHWVRAVDVKETPHRAHLYEQADDVRVKVRTLGRRTYGWDLRSRGLASVALRDIDWVFHLAADHGGAGYFHSHADFKA